jgi:hypothetical protein
MDAAIHAGCRLSQLGGNLPVVDVEGNGHLSLSNVLFDKNYGPSLSAGGDGASKWAQVDALIHVGTGAVRLEGCSWPQNPHKFAVALTDTAGRVYSVPQITVQVRIFKRSNLV